MSMVLGCRVTVPRKQGISEALQISIETADSEPRKDAGIVYRGISFYSPKSHFHVVLKNCSAQTVRLWQPDCPRGNKSLYFEITDTDNRKRHEIRTAREYSGQGNRTVSLRPWQSVIYDIYFDQFWRLPFPTDKESRHNVMMRAVYEVEADDKAHESKAWIGKVETEWEYFALTFRRNLNQ